MQSDSHASSFRKFRYLRTLVEDFPHVVDFFSLELVQFLMNLRLSFTSLARLYLLPSFSAMFSVDEDLRQVIY